MTTITTRSGKGSPLTNNEVDANFTNLNDDKVEASGDSMTGNLSFGDNNKAIFGAGSDLQIYHDGLASYIKENGTGDLIIQGSNTMRFQGSSNQELANFTTGGAVTLFNNGSAKLATTSTGIDVTGDITLGDTNPTITFNDSSVTNLSHTISSASDNLRIMADVNGVDAGSRVEIFDGTTEVARFEAGAVDVTGTVTADGLTVDGATGEFKGSGANTTYFTGGDDSIAGRQLTLSSEANGGQNNATHRLTVPSGYGSFNVSVGGSERFKINNNGDISFYEDTGTTAKLFWDASAESLGIGTTSPFRELEVTLVQAMFMLVLQRLQHQIAQL